MGRIRRCKWNGLKPERKYGLEFVFRMAWRYEYCASRAWNRMGVLWGNQFPDKRIPVSKQRCSGYRNALFRILWSTQSPHGRSAGWSGRWFGWLSLQQYGSKYLPSTSQLQRWRNRIGKLSERSAVRDCGMPLGLPKGIVYLHARAKVSYHWRKARWHGSNAPGFIAGDRLPSR